ncbi:MAG TPA: glycosyltransferase family 4 protein, partial [Pyrinomonadaceae bacterium]
MRLAYFSPLGPQRSGIADYSEELLPHLAAAGAEVTLFVEGFRPANEALAARFDVRDYVRDPAALSTLGEFDAAVYHMGNDHRYHTGIHDAMRARPGVVVFHDFGLQDFFLGLARERGDLRIYLDEVGACHGAQTRREAADVLAQGGTPAVFERPLDFPVNCRLARSAEGIIVHSEWSRARFEAIAPNVPTRRIPMGVVAPPAHAPLEDVAGARPVRLASFGLVTPGKGIESALRALAALRDGHDFRYALVGATNNYFDVRALVRQYGLEDRVEITCHVTLEEFGRRISETDVALNLRERTSGETSASLCRIMAAGVCSVVSDVGWFSELPDAAVVKVAPGAHSDELLRAYLKRLIEDAPLRARLGANARRHALEEYDLRRSAERYLSFVAEVAAARPRRRLLAGLSAELALLGVEPAADEALVRGVASEFAALAPQRLFNPARAEAAPLWGQPDAPAAAAPPHAGQAVSAAPPGGVSGNGAHAAAAPNGRGPKLEGVDYKRAAVEYP